MMVLGMMGVLSAVGWCRWLAKKTGWATLRSRAEHTQGDQGQGMAHRGGGFE